MVAPSGEGQRKWIAAARYIKTGIPYGKQIVIARKVVGQDPHYFSGKVLSGKRRLSMEQIVQLASETSLDATELLRLYGYTSGSQLLEILQVRRVDSGSLPPLLEKSKELQRGGQSSEALQLLDAMIARLEGIHYTTSETKHHLFDFYLTKLDVHNSNLTGDALMTISGASSHAGRPIPRLKGLPTGTRNFSPLQRLRDLERDIGTDRDENGNSFRSKYNFAIGDTYKAAWSRLNFEEAALRLAKASVNFTLQDPTLKLLALRSQLIVQSILGSKEQFLETNASLETLFSGHSADTDPSTRVFILEAWARALVDRQDLGATEMRQAIKHYEDAVLLLDESGLSGTNIASENLHCRVRVARTKLHLARRGLLQLEEEAMMNLASEIILTATRIGASKIAEEATIELKELTTMVS